MGQERFGVLLYFGHAEDVRGVHSPVPALLQQPAARQPLRQCVAKIQYWQLHLQEAWDELAEKLDLRCVAHPLHKSR